MIMITTCKCIQMITACMIYYMILTMMILRIKAMILFVTCMYIYTHIFPHLDIHYTFQTSSGMWVGAEKS